MEKKTAVEWLFLMMNNPNTDKDFANKLFKKAKEMEKQQIIDFADEYGTYILKRGQMSATTYIKLE